MIFIIFLGCSLHSFTILLGLLHLSSFLLLQNSNITFGYRTTHYFLCDNRILFSSSSLLIFYRAALKIREFCTDHFISSSHFPLIIILWLLLHSLSFPLSLKESILLYAKFLPKWGCTEFLPQTLPLAYFNTLRTHHTTTPQNSLIIYPLNYYILMYRTLPPPLSEFFTTYRQRDKIAHANH